MKFQGEVSNTHQSSDQVHSSSTSLTSFLPLPQFSIRIAVPNLLTIQLLLWDQILYQMAQRLETKIN